MFWFLTPFCWHKRVFTLQVKDEEKQEKTSRNAIIGKGFLDLVGMFKTPREIEFPVDGSVSLEYEANANNPISDIQQSLNAAEDAIAKAV